MIGTLSGTGFHKVAVCLIIVLVTALVIYLIGLYFRKFGVTKLHTQFLEKVLMLIVLVIGAGTILATLDDKVDIAHMLVGSTVVLGAFAGFAAQEIIGDVLSGVMISISRPFDIGDQIEVEGLDRSLTVEMLTLRHTVLCTSDGMHYVIPNSKISGMVIVNTSYRTVDVSSYIEFEISHTSDIRKAMDIVRRAVEESPFTVPVTDEKNGEHYGKVYIKEVKPRAIVLETLIWMSREENSDLAVSELRSTVLTEFRLNGIEIPHEYVSVVMREEQKPDEEELRQMKVDLSGQRYFAADEVIFREGAKHDRTMFEVLWGKAAIYSKYGTDRQKCLAVLQRGEFFGEFGVLNGKSRSATAVAADDCQVRVITEMDLIDFAEHDTDKILRIMRQMSRRMRVLTDDYMDACDTAEEYLTAEHEDRPKSRDLMERMKRFAAQRRN